MGTTIKLQREISPQVLMTELRAVYSYLPKKGTAMNLIASQVGVTSGHLYSYLNGKVVRLHRRHLTALVQTARRANCPCVSHFED